MGLPPLSTPMLISPTTEVYMKHSTTSERPAVSVIIPVYNAGYRLRRCLDAVCRQSLRDIEIICVDDGSTDDSADVLREYATQYCWLKFVMLPRNIGAAAARNRGMEVARGEYLGFIDSDDYPVLDFYEKLYLKAVETRADVVKGNYRYWDLDGRSRPVDYILNERIKEYRTNFSFAFCSAIYRRQLFTDHGVIFPEDQIDLEDPVFTLKIALLCTSIALVDDAEVNISINKDSSTFGPPDIRRIASKFKGLSRIIDILNANENLDGRSYAFIVAFWFKSVVDHSLPNKTIQAYRFIVNSLFQVFGKIRYHAECLTEFSALGLSDLFGVLISGKIGQLATYILSFYDSKILLAVELRFRALKKSHQQAKGACVVIPVCAPPTPAEAISLRQCLDVLGKRHRIIFFGPESLDTAPYENAVREHGVEWFFEKFEDIFFESTATYSRLLLSQEFYSRFIHWEYILIHQLDSWVFRDELSLWCGKGYDYIGAPWFEGYSEASEDSPMLCPSGNGGFSLRKVWPFLESLHTLEGKIAADDLDGMDEVAGIFYNEFEDIIIVELFPRIMNSFMIAPPEEAMHFSFEVFPERLFALTGGLPFGCHAYMKYNPEFWNPYIPLESFLPVDVS